MDCQERWSHEILQGIDEIPISGTPGAIVVYGHQAAPILSSTNPRDLIIAAAQLGKGRIIVFSHDCYYHQFIKNDNVEYKTLNENVKSWLCHDKDVPVFSLENETSVPENTPAIFAWRGSDQKNDPFYCDLLKSVRDGCGLLLAMTPWGYLCCAGGVLTDMPMYTILKEIGMCYTDGYYNGPKPLPVKDNHAVNAHLSRLLSKDLSLVDQSSCNVITQGLRYMPICAKEQFRSVLNKFDEAELKTVSPSCTNPCKGNNKIKLSLYMEMLDLRGGSCSKAFGIESFPGDCGPCPLLETITLELFSENDEVLPTGYYLPAGLSMVVTVLSADEPAKWRMRIGAHSDDISNHDEWKRWPNICLRVQLSEVTHTVSSPFGGLVYICGPKKKSIKLKLDNVMKAPYYNMSDPVSVCEWQTRKHCPAPWADLIGKNIILTLPSNVVRDRDPMEALQFWDTIVQAHYDLRGVELGRQWFVPDVQPSAGYMHSGYPVVTHMDVAEPDNEHFVLNVASLRKTGSWGHFHEVGHNLQKSAWTFEGTGEVTCNIFTLHAMDTVCGIKPWIHPWLQNSLDSAKNYLKGKNKFGIWQSKPGVALFIYAQLVRDFGWNAYRKVFREYEHGENNPDSFQQKIDQWIVTFSNVTERNLIPLFEFWGFPISKECRPFVSHMTPYLPDDELTRYAESKTFELVKEYSNLDRKGNIL